MKISRIIKVSRPRFWIYELGPYLIGLIGAYTVAYGGGIAGTPMLLDFRTIAFFIYFLIPANILIYGINDIYDYETDKLNPKKTGYEDLLTPDTHKSVWKWILGANLPFLLFLPWTNLPVVISFFAFIFFASFYSAKPIRAKIRPVLDSFFSAGHYVATGVFSFLLVAHELNVIVDVRWMLVIAGILWAMAMHAYSAVPDIRADKEAGFATIATLFGYKGTVILCAIFYGLAGILSFSVLGFFSLIFGAMYVILMVYSYRVVRDPDRLFRAYTWFPRINGVIGFLIFWIVALGL